MKRKNFSLRPFQDDLSEMEIKGHVARRASILHVRYEIIGNLQKVDIPVPKQNPSRVKGLWENTCLELFVAVQGYDQYWEVNLSPSGDWNVFRFDLDEGQRRIDKLQEELIFDALPITSKKQSGSFSLDFEFNLDGIIPEGKLLEIGVSAVITSPKTYWALTHCDAKPNFHRRESFTIKL